jgi:hypothetical protein
MTGTGNKFADGGAVSISQGGSLDFQNLQNAPHNVYAVKPGPDGGPLFDRATFNVPATKSVEGVQYLQAGSYPFHCTLHVGMTGTLTVTSDGTPVARPKIAVAIKSSKLASVQKSGALKTRVSDSGSDAVVDLVALVGSKKLGHVSQVDVAAGATEPVSVKLSRSGQRALKGRSTATVKLKGTVAFGKPDAAAAKLK